MPRPQKRLSEFDARLGEAIAHRRKHPDVALSQKALSRATGIALSNLQRREDGTNEVTVSELERIAKALSTTSVDLVQDALSRYGGIDKLIAEYTEPAYVIPDGETDEEHSAEFDRLMDTMSAAPDNITGIRPKRSPKDGAQKDIDERQPHAANFDREHLQDEPDPA